MKISRLQAQNFKSFDTVDVELGDFNVFIGANASGKSNFLSILSFLRDVAREGLKDAVSIQSGMIDLLRNVQLGPERQTEIKIDWGYGTRDPGQLTSVETKGEIGPISAKFSGFEYELVLEHERSNFKVFREQTTWAGYLSDRREKSEGAVFDTISNDRTSLSSRIAPSPPSGLFDPVDDPKRSFLDSESKGILSVSTRHELESIRIYDFVPNRLMSSAAQKGRSYLEEDGRNIALVLQNLLQDDENRRKFTNLTSVLLPFVEGLDVDRFTGQSLLVKLQEAYSGEAYLPASLLSEGTVKTIALLIALYFEDERTIAFEEPATSLHPKLISQLVQMMEEVSEKKQIFITTHNPEVLKHVDLNDVYLVSRGEDGFSQISKPVDKTEVRTFLENDLGIDDLFVQNLL